MAEGAQIPGKDGGCCKKIFRCCCYSCPTPQAEHSSLHPAAQRGWIGQACRIFAVQRCLPCRLTSGDPFAGLLSAMQAVMSERHQPVRQDRDSVVALPTEATPNPHACVHVVVRLAEPLAMTNDGCSLTNWTPPRQAIQWNYPGSLLSSASGNAITRIRLALRGATDRSRKGSDLLAALHPPQMSGFSFE
jgi:hypothetical protein